MKTITTTDLTLPSNVLGGAVLENWCGPVKFRQDTLRGVWSSDCGWHPSRVEIDCTRPEVRDRLFRVLAKGKRCPGCSRCVDPAHGPHPIAVHELRPPHVLTWLLDAEAIGEITPTVAAALWWVNTLRVDAGLPVSGDLPLHDSHITTKNWKAQVDTHLSHGRAIHMSDHLILPAPSGTVRLNLGV